MRPRARAAAGDDHLRDGYRDVLFNASPVLLRLGLRATAYVVSGRISGGDPSFLTWPLLHALERRGIEIGSHTVAHRRLTSMPDGALLADLTASRRALERALGHAVPRLAYPFGASDARVERAARRAGYLLAVRGHDRRAGTRRPAPVVRDGAFKAALTAVTKLARRRQERRTPMQTTTRTPIEIELDYRSQDGIAVSLLWQPDVDVLIVQVADARTGETFQLVVDAHEALDVFRHPFAHAAFRGVPLAAFDPPALAA